MTNKQVTNALRQYHVTKKQFPICCPMPDQPLWDAHPRVYLAMDDGRAVCPYCEAEYILIDDTEKS